MTATPIRTARQQLDEMLLRFEARTARLLRAEVWDEEQIELVAKLQYTFTEVIGKDEASLANYLSESWGVCGFTQEEQAQWVPFKADEWNAGDKAPGFDHDYLSQYCDEYVPYLPEGWCEVPSYEFDWNVQPAVGEKLIDLLCDYTSVQDVEDLLEVDVLGDDRELCGEALVMTGYLTNQENLTGDDLTFLQVYKVFRDVLEESLANQEDV